MSDDAREVALQHLFNDLDRDGRIDLLVYAVENKHEAGLKLMMGALERQPAVTPEDVARFAYQQGELNGIKRILHMLRDLAAEARKLRQPQEP